MKTFALILLAISSFLYINKITKYTSLEELNNYYKELEQQTEKVKQSLMDSNINIDLDTLYSILYWTAVICKMLFYIIIAICLIK